MKSTSASLLLLLTSFSATACGPSLDSMHERAKAGRVQDQAPLHAHRTVVIAAPRERVYRLVTDVAGWPRWQPTVARVTAPEAVTPGTRFTWTNGGTEINSQIATLVPNELVAWTGSVSTAKAIHVWHFTSPTPSTTMVDVEETMDGLLLTWFYGQKELDAEMARSLENLQRAAEGASR